METLQQQNRITLQAPKVQLVRKIIILGIVFFVTLFCKAQDISSDYVIFNKILGNKNLQDHNLKRYVCLSNKNKMVIQILEEQEKALSSGNRKAYDSLKTDKGITDNKIHNSIFNQREYDYLISQNQNSKWDLSKSKVKVYTLDQSSTTKSKSIFISKPIYTSNGKFALVYFEIGTASAIAIYEKKGDDWIETGLIDANIAAKKAVYHE